MGMAKGSNKYNQGVERVWGLFGRFLVHLKSDPAIFEIYIYTPSIGDGNLGGGRSRLKRAGFHWLRAVHMPKELVLDFVGYQGEFSYHLTEI